jgi:Protein of unknown function (DUF3710)
VFRRRRREDGSSASEATDETCQPAEPAEDDEDYSYADEDDEAADYDEPDYDEPDYAESDYAESDDAGPVADAGQDGGQAGAYEAVGEAAASHPDRADLSDPMTWTRLRDTQAAEPAMARTAGPWDGADQYPEQPRIDFGSLLVPVRDGYDIQVLMSEEEGISIAVVRGESGLQLQPFAAPRSSGLWHEVLPEIEQEVAKVGGQSAEQYGPFGPELLARVIPQGAPSQPVAPQPMRFIGVDGPRWFLRGLISGPAAVDDELAQQFRDIFADVVVVRGDQAQPPRQPLQIQLPEEARQVLEGQPADEQPNPFNPFERGPEITETR